MKFVNPGKLSSMASILQTWIESPAGQKAVESVERERLQKRATVFAQLQATPAKYAKAGEAAWNKLQKKQDALDAARRAVDEAIQAVATAMGESLGVSYAQERDLGQLTRELEDTADPRIMGFVDQLQGIRSLVRNMNPIMFTKEPRGMFGDLHDVVVTDPKFGVAMDAITSAIERATGMRLQVLTSTEVTDALTAITGELEPLLKSVGAPLPVVNAADALGLE